MRTESELHDDITVDITAEHLLYRLIIIIIDELYTVIELK